MGAHLGTMSTESNVCGLEPLLSVGELAEYLGVPVATVYDWRSHGTGPVGHRFGKHVKFAVSDVRMWIESRRDVPTCVRTGGRGPADTQVRGCKSSNSQTLRKDGE